MMTVTLKAESRNGLTKSGVKQLRSSGKVPGVVYGKKIGTVSIMVDAKELLALLRSNSHAIVEMDLPGAGLQPVMIHDVQRDQLSRDLLHIDFHQINMDEPVRTSVPLEFEGEPKGEKEGGMLQIQLHEVEVRCLPAHIPASIAVNVEALEMGDSVAVRDLVVPANVEIKAHPDDVVATILAPQKEAPEDEAQKAAEVQQPVQGAEAVS